MVKEGKERCSPEIVDASLFDNSQTDPLATVRFVPGATDLDPVYCLSSDGISCNEPLPSQCTGDPDAHAYLCDAFNSSSLVGDSQVTKIKMANTTFTSVTVTEGYRFVAVGNAG